MSPVVRLSEELQVLRKASKTVSNLHTKACGGSTVSKGATRGS